MVVTEDLGKIFEKAICILYKIEYGGNYKYSIDQANQLAERLLKLKDLVPYNLLHIAKNGNKYDFHIIENNTYLSAKTSKKNGKVSPQVIGQPSKQTFCEYFKLDLNITLDQIKDHIQINNKYLLKEYSVNTFNCPIIYYNKHKNNLLYICLIKEIDWDQYNIVFSHIIKNKKWNESTTISINNKSIGEYQIHKHRNCIKFRWSFENVLTIFKDYFNIIAL